VLSISPFLFIAESRLLHPNLLEYMVVLFEVVVVRRLFGYAAGALTATATVRSRKRKKDEGRLLCNRKVVSRSEESTYRAIK
jgi:hypothetical protein